MFAYQARLTHLSVQILSRLVLLYFASETADNPELRQCLSYFFPVYCYSNPENQRRLASVSQCVCTSTVMHSDTLDMARR